MKSIVEQIQNALEEQELEKVYTLFHQFMNEVTEEQIEELIELAAFSASSGFFDEARQAYLLLTQFEPEESAWTILLAEILVNQGEYDQALSVLYDIPEDNQNYPSVLVILSELYKAQGYYDVAERKLLLAKEFAPEETILDFYLGTLLFESGAMERSVQYLERFLKNSHEETGEENRARELLVEASLEIGNAEPLQELLSDEGLESASNELLVTIAKHDVQEGNVDHAEKLYQEILSRDAENYEALLGLSHIQMFKHEYLKAIMSLSKMTETYPYEKEPFFSLGVSYLSIGQMEKGQEALKQAYELSPESFEIMQAYTEVLLYQEEFEEVQDILASEIEEGIENGQIFYLMARAKEGLEEFEEALEFYQKASVELEDSVEFIIDYVGFLREEGRTTEAKEWLEHGQNLEPLNEDLQELQQYFEA